MGKLVTRPNLADPDATYARLVAAHEGLSAEASAALNVRLVVTLANHIGDDAVVAEAIALAMDAGGESDPPNGGG